MTIKWLFVHMIDDNICKSSLCTCHLLWCEIEMLNIYARSEIMKNDQALEPVRNLNV